MVLHLLSANTFEPINKNITKNLRIPIRNLKANTQAQSRLFDNLRPKNQKFDKLLLAKVWNTSITDKDRELDLKTFQIPYEERDHALYVAFGPYKNPRYALSILVEHGGNGSTTAAPMAKELFKLIIDRHSLRQSINDKRYLDI